MCKTLVPGHLKHPILVKKSTLLSLFSHLHSFKGTKVIILCGNEELKYLFFSHYKSMGIFLDAQGQLSTVCGLFVCLRLYITVNNYSVILGCLPGFIQY